MMRIGPVMLAIQNYVSSHPGCVMYEAAVACGPHGSAKYGYRAIHRALKAGLIRYVSGKGNAKLLFTITERNPS